MEEARVELGAVPVVDGDFGGAEEVYDALDEVADLDALVDGEVVCVFRVEELDRGDA